MGILSTFKAIVAGTDPNGPAKPSFKPVYRIELKVKAKSLLAEMWIIRAEEEKQQAMIDRLYAKYGNEPQAKQAAWISGHRYAILSLKSHRYGLAECHRSTNLARGFLKGWAYARMEPKRYCDPDWDAVERMIVKYGRMSEQDAKQHFERWKQEAGEPAVRGPRQPRIRPNKKAAEAATA